MPWLRRLIADLSPRRPDFDSWICGGHCGIGTGFLGVLRFSRQSHSTKAPHPSSSTCCTYQKDKRRKLGNLQKSNVTTDGGLSLRMATTDTGTLQTKAYEQTHNAQQHGVCLGDVTSSGSLPAFRKNLLPTPSG